MRDRVKEGQMWLLFIVTMWIVINLCSCTTVEYVPVKVETKDSIYLNKYIRDSIYFEVQTDSKTVNDTVYIHQTKYKYKEKLVTDTMYVERVDSIQVPYPVERKLGKWEQTCLNYGGEAIISCVVLFFIIIWIVFKRL